MIGLPVTFAKTLNLKKSDWVKLTLNGDSEIIMRKAEI
jgi:antitoxin component of MazEF toxin-antitoxin module